MTLVGLVTIILSIALIGFIVYLAVTYIPMPEPFKQVIIVACVILIIIFLLAFINGGVSSPRLIR